MRIVITGAAAAFVIGVATGAPQDPPPPPEGAVAVVPDATPKPATPVPRSARPVELGSRSLADTVRTAQPAETPAKKRSLGVITNESLKKDGDSAAGKGTPTPSYRGARGSAAGPQPGPVTGEGRDDVGRTEADWKARAAAARKRVDAAEENVRRLETETKRLENDFYAWSDGVYRDNVIKKNWDRALADLQKARNEVTAARAGLDALEEDARKSGAPPGWLR